MTMRRTRWLFLLGIVAALLAATSIFDMFLPRPYDGVVLKADVFGELITKEVVPGSGAHRAGIRPGDRIVGIDRIVVRSKAEAAESLNSRRIGDVVPYLIEDDWGRREIDVELGRRQIGSASYLFACLLGFAFWIIGSFVLLRQPGHRGAQIFSILCSLFLLFLVCRLRPASYSQVDHIVLTVGTIALLFLPASFLHFFLIFPRAVPWRPTEGERGYARKHRVWISILFAVYVIPPVVLASSLIRSHLSETSLPLVSGAPIANWWVLVVYMLLGLAVLAVNSRRIEDRRERLGALWVFVGALVGLAPLLAMVVAFPAMLDAPEFLFFGLAPLSLVPLTFAYAIVRFQFLDVRIFLRKSLVYTILTAVVTGLYALGIAIFNVISSGLESAAGRYFPLAFALAIVLLLDPLRRRLQIVLDRFFYAERNRLQRAIRELGEGITGEGDPREVVRELFQELPRHLGLSFAGLYLRREGRHERIAGPASLPERLPELVGLHEALADSHKLRDLDQLGEIGFRLGPDGDALKTLREQEVEVIGSLKTTRRSLGLVVFSRKQGQILLDREERELLEGLLGQVAIALETSTLLDERAEQAELERELEIAASVQDSLVPDSVDLGPGWEVAATCRPARHVGGDFYTELPGPTEADHAIVYGDVAGKSVSGALVMMAAHEALQSLALTERDPERLLALANQRLYGLGRRRSFVALGYLAVNGRKLSYVLAGQPQPILRSRGGEVIELDLPEHRIPLGALDQGTYRPITIDMEEDDLVLGYSDGVVEAQSPSGEFFGGERLLRLVAEQSGSPEELVATILGELERFTAGMEAYDDITLIALRRKAGANDA